MKSEHDQVKKLLVLFLLLFSFAIGGLIAVNIHDLIHIKCGAAGECFGASELLRQLSLLPFWILLPNAVAMALLLSTLPLLIIVHAQSTSNKPLNQKSALLLTDIRKTLLRFFLASAALTLLFSGTAFWFIAQT